MEQEDALRRATARRRESIKSSKDLDERFRRMNEKTILRSDRSRFGTWGGGRADHGDGDIRDTGHDSVQHNNTANHDARQYNDDNIFADEWHHAHARNNSESGHHAEPGNQSESERSARLRDFRDATEWND